jgi:Tat protein secretion system quality control protein TatD with DNase activity
MLLLNSSYSENYELKYTIANYFFYIPKASELEHLDSRLRFTNGFHPKNVRRHHASAIDKLFHAVMNLPGVVGLGEIGLDRFSGYDNYYSEQVDFLYRLLHKVWRT